LFGGIRSKFSIRTQLTAQARSKFIVELISVVGPIKLIFALYQNILTAITMSPALKLSFTETNELVSSFSESTQFYTATFSKYFPVLSVLFSRSTMPTPNTTIQVIVTITDQTGTPQTACNPVTCVVTFPDLSSSSYALGTGITNIGSGQYRLQYTTKGPGVHRELWSVTNVDGSVAQSENLTSVAY